MRVTFIASQPLTVGIAVFLLASCSNAEKASIEQLRAATHSILMEVTPGELSCSACQFTGRALRQSVTEVMPKRVKHKAKRRELAASALQATGEKAVCHKSRFPKTVVKQNYTRQDGSEASTYRDLEDLRRAQGGTLTSKHFELAEGALANLVHITQVCDVLLRELHGLMLEKMVAGTGRVYTDVSDNWLCVTAGKLCNKGEVGEADEDEAEEL